MYFSSSPIEESGVFTRGWIYASLQTSLLVIITIITAIFYERGSPDDLSLVAMSLWSITPLPCHTDEHCIPSFDPQSSVSEHDSSGHQNSTAVHDDCMLNSNHEYYFYTSYGERGSNSLCNLIGESPLFEREGQNLFSVMGIPFLLVASHVISAVFSLMYIRNDSIDNTHNSSSNVQKSLKKIGLLMLIVYATSFLFIQNTWKIPGNNLFLVEIFFLFIIFVLAFRPSSYFSECSRHQVMTLRSCEYVLTLPLIACAVLSTAGNTSVNDITTAFFSLLFANTFFALLEMDKESHKLKPHQQSPFIADNYTLGGPQSVLLLNAWLCMIPFIMHCSLTISNMMDRLDTYKSWVLAPIVILLLYQILYALITTIYSVIVYSETTQKYFTFFSFIQNDHAYYYNSLHFVLDFLSFSAQASISLSILVGALSSFSKS